MRARRLRPAALVSCLLVVAAGAGASSLSPSDQDRVDALRHRIVFDRKDAEARVELARILGDADDIEYRREATNALEEASRLEPRNAEVWVLLARLQDRRGFRRESWRAFDRAVRAEPRRADIWGELSQHELEWYQQSLLRAHRSRAEAANRRELALEPGRPEGLHRAVRLAAFRGQEELLPGLVRDWREHAPQDPWPRLYLGMLYAREHAWDRASEEFEAGLALLPEADRRAFLSLAVVDPKAEDALEFAADSTRYRTDYWRLRDPTPADARNPRLLEHYRRLVEAELYFGLDEQEVRGWDHDPGTMLVRYGLPAGWRFDRDLIETTQLYGSYIRTTSLQPRVILIAFGPPTFPLPFQFVDSYLTGRYHLPVEAYLDDEDEFMAQVPSLYDPPFTAPERNQEIELWRFRDPDGEERLEVAVAVDPDAWPASVLAAPYRLATTMTVYDPEWRVEDTAVSSWAPMERDPLGRLVGRFVLAGNADSLIVGLETVDREDAGRSVAYYDLPPEPRDAGIGELAFLSRVSFDPSGAPYGRTGGRALPNPGRIYPEGEPIGVAFQARGLAEDGEGLHHARIRLSVGRAARNGWLDVLVGRGQNPRQAELRFDHVDEGPALDAMMQVDVPPLDPGEYRLRVVVEDALGDLVLERSGNFRVVERKAP